MYSPKIREDLIPKLYRLAKARNQPMTKLISDLIEESLVGEEIPETVEESQRTWKEGTERKRKGASVRRIRRQPQDGYPPDTPDTS